MNKAIVGFLAFAAGAGIGVAATQQYFKKKYEQIALEEITSMKEKYSNVGVTESSEPVEEYPTPDDFDEEDHEEYESIISENGYTNYSRLTLTESKGKDYMTSEPYVIEPTEFGELEDYAQVSLMFYTDGVLADENDDPINDVDDLIGTDSLTHFGEYEDDSVYVRNERLKCDYEILLSLKSHEEVMACKVSKPEPEDVIEQDLDDYEDEDS